MEVADGLPDQGSSELKAIQGSGPVLVVGEGPRGKGPWETFAWAWRIVPTNKILRNPLPTEAGLKEAIHLTCLESCAPHPQILSASWQFCQTGHTTFAQGRACF